MARDSHSHNLKPMQGITKIAFGHLVRKFGINLILKGKGIRFIVLYRPKRSHNLPPLAGIVHTETISIPRGIFQSNWQHIAHTL